MEGALLVSFFCIIMPISLLYLGLKFGWPYAEYTREGLIQVWDTCVTRKPIEPEPPLPEIDILDEKVAAILAARKRNPRLERERHLLDNWEDAERTRPRRDYDDKETVRDWQGNTLRWDFRTKKCEHDHTMVCFRCERHY